MKKLTLLLWALVPLILLTHANSTLAESLCDAREVQLKNNLIQIEPNGLDDTANIQCALDLAVERNIPEIRLTRGDFYISTLAVQNFRGTLQGGGKDYTRIRLLEKSIQCETGSAAITFAGGEPRVRWLSLIWDDNLEPCALGSGLMLKTLLNFTTIGDAPSSCSSDVIAATVDRVVLQGPEMWWHGEFFYRTALRVEPTRTGSDCHNALLGSFGLNRSVINRFPYGVEIQMRGGATVGIHNNSFVDNNIGIAVRNSGANVAVTGNYFASANFEPRSNCTIAGRGMILENSETYQNVTQLDVHANTFEVATDEWCHGIGLQLTRAPGAADARIVISRNKFMLLGYYYSGDEVGTAISSDGVSGAIAKGNEFTNLMFPGEWLHVIQVEAGMVDLVTDWTIDSNRGFAEPESWATIFLGENVTKTLIGPAQGAVVIDYGYDNTVLPQ